jgi:hypothetical protein
MRYDDADQLHSHLQKSDAVTQRTACTNEYLVQLRGYICMPGTQRLPEVRPHDHFLAHTYAYVCMHINPHRQRPTPALPPILLPALTQRTASRPHPHSLRRARRPRPPAQRAHAPGCGVRAPQPGPFRRFRMRRGGLSACWQAAAALGACVLGLASWQRLALLDPRGATTPSRPSHSRASACVSGGQGPATALFTVHSFHKQQWWRKMTG